MATTLYELNLDLTKELNYTKAILARQGDIGLTVRVNLFKHGLPLTIKSTDIVTMKGTTPTGKYVDARGEITGNSIDFNLDGNFMSESGYYQNCYVEYNDGTHNLTTQDIIFFSLRLSDVSSEQAKPYISRLEELITLYNETFDQFMSEITVKADEINTKLDNMGTQATSLKTQLDTIQTQIDSLDLDKWKLEVLTESKAYSDTTSNKALVDSKTYTDTKVSESKRELESEISVLNQSVTKNTSDIVDLTNKNNVEPIIIAFQQGSQLNGPKTNSRLPLGTMGVISNPTNRTNPVTFSSGNYELTTSRNCQVYVECCVDFQFATATTDTDYAYVKFNYGSATGDVGTKADLIKIGNANGQRLALGWTSTGQGFFTLNAGDKFAITLETRDSKPVSRWKLISLKITIIE